MSDQESKYNSKEEYKKEMNALEEIINAVREGNVAKAEQGEGEEAKRVQYHSLSIPITSVGKLLAENGVEKGSEQEAQIYRYIGLTQIYLHLSSNDDRYVECVNGLTTEELTNFFERKVKKALNTSDSADSSELIEFANLLPRKRAAQILSKYTSGDIRGLVKWIPVDFFSDIEYAKIVSECTTDNFRYLGSFITDDFLNLLIQRRLTIQEWKEVYENYLNVKKSFMEKRSDKEKANFLSGGSASETDEYTIWLANSCKLVLMQGIQDSVERARVVNSLERCYQRTRIDETAEAMIREFVMDNFKLTPEQQERLDAMFNSYEVIFPNVDNSLLGLGNIAGRFKRSSGDTEKDASDSMTEHMGDDLITEYSGPNGENYGFPTKLRVALPERIIELSPSDSDSHIELLRSLIYARAMALCAFTELHQEICAFTEPHQEICVYGEDLGGEKKGYNTELHQQMAATFTNLVIESYLRKHPEKRRQLSNKKEEAIRKGEIDVLLYAHTKNDEDLELIKDWFFNNGSDRIKSDFLVYFCEADEEDRGRRLNLKKVSELDPWLFIHNLEEIKRALKRPDLIPEKAKYRINRQILYREGNEILESAGNALKIARGFFERVNHVHQDNKAPKPGDRNNGQRSL